MKASQYKMDMFPLNTEGRIVDFDDQNADLPVKIIEMGLLPDTLFKIVYEAPFGGPLYIEFGNENSRVALRKSEAKLILVERI